MVSSAKTHAIGDPRRRRLSQLLSCEGERASSRSGLSSPTIHGARSLPALPSLHSTKSATLTDFDVALVPPSEQGPLLSPLKITRRSGRASVAMASVSPDEPPSSIEALHTPNAAMSSKILPAGARSTRLSTRDVLTRQKSRERTKSDAALLLQRREAAREQYIQRLEVTRRRASVAAASQSFFDRLASLPIREAIQLFEDQREALQEFCLQQFLGQVDDDELKAIHTDLQKMMAKAHKDLQMRLSKLQADELQAAQKKQALQSLKKSHQDQIERRLSAAKEQRKHELAARELIVKEQERLDRSYEARQVEIKRHTETHSEKLAEQIKNNAVARSTFKLAVQGSSPLYRTPWWSDESEERLVGFQRPMTVQAPMQSPVIHSKQRCQWYD